MTTTKITVDLRQRSFTIEVPESQLENVLDRIASLFRQESEFGELDIEDQNGNGETASDASTASDRIDREIDTIKLDTKKKKSNPRAKSWDVIDLNLNPEQRNSIREFFELKNPKSQNDSIAVLIFKIKEISGKSSFNGNEVHSALKIVGRPTPKNLYAVFANMKKAGIASHSDNNLICNSLTEDYVNFHMKTEKDKK